VLSELPCELAVAELQPPFDKSLPIAVIVGAKPEERELAQSLPISAVNSKARSFGVRPGQTIAEACAWVAHLKVLSIAESRLDYALERVAECLLQFSPIVAIGAPDTLWLDVTGTTALFGDEEELVKRIRSCLAELGHFSRIAISRGPILARAFARWGSLSRGQAGIIVPESETLKRVQQLPIQALPVSADVMQWLAQLGLLQLADLARIDPAKAASRLGESASPALDMLQGRDLQPLTAYVPAALPHEQIQWDEPCSGNEPILFALKLITTRIAARLEARGLAASGLTLNIRYDAVVARFNETEPCLTLDYTLVEPLFRADELWRILTARLGKLRLMAPYVEVRVAVSGLALATTRQLELINAASKLNADPERLSVLINELAADIGNDRLGTLTTGNSHLPEKHSSLRPITKLGTAASEKSRVRSRRKPAPGAMEQLNLQRSAFSKHPPNRLFNNPRLLRGPIKKGALISVGTSLYSVESMEFECRLERIEWWSGSNLSRDYWRVGLSNKSGYLNALVYFNRDTEECFLQALYD
jgi:protein ImuB